MAPSYENADGLSFGDRGGWPGSAAEDGASLADRSPNPSEVIDAVVRRSDFLSELMDGPIHKPALQSELGVSRSTVYKAIRELAELQLVERTDGGYRVSLAGRLLFERYRQFRGSVEAVSGPAALLSVLPPECPISAEFLDGAEAVYAEPHAPYYPIRAFEELVDRPANLRGASPVVLPEFVEMHREQVVSGGRRSELILSEPVIECLLSNSSDAFPEALATGRLSVRKTGRRLPFGLLVADDPAAQVAVLVYDARGDLRGLLSNDTERARDWAADVWALFRDRSTVVTDELREVVDEYGSDSSDRPDGGIRPNR